MKTYLRTGVFCLLALASCRSEQDGSGQSAVDRHNEKVAQEAVQAIKTPLEQAKKAAELENLHNKKMEDQLKMQ